MTDYLPVIAVILCFLPIGWLILDTIKIHRRTTRARREERADGDW
jgi:hypothetical protein